MGADESLILPLPSASLAFGLEWLPLLGGRAERLGLRLARRHKATHMVLAGESAGSVGLAAFKASRAQRKTGLHSAAQNVAHLFSTGTVALLLQLEQAGYWLVAVHEGAVVARTDRLYRSGAQAEPVLAELRQAYPQLVLLGAALAPDMPTLAAIEAASGAHSRLHAVSAWRPLLPWPVQCFVLALVLVLLVPRLWHSLGSGPRAAEHKQAADPRQAWQSAIERSAQHRYVHGVQGTRILLDALYRLPVRVGGWALRQAECSAQSRQWHCRARYERRGVLASNSRFLAGSPGNWTVEFISIDLAQPAWHMSSYATPVPAGHLKTSSDNERGLFSTLQAIRPVFGQMQLGKPALLPVAAPMDGQGRTLSRPPGMAAYLTRPVQFSGPLRSIGMLLPHAASMAWSKAVLTLHDIDQPGVKTSRLNLSLQGVLYEIEAHADHRQADRVSPA